MRKIKHYFMVFTEYLTKNLTDFTSFKFTTPTAIIFSAIIISVSIIGHGVIVKANESAAQVSMFNGRPVDKTDYIEGNPDSKVVVIEYSDPECPYCVKLHPTTKELRDKYSDKVAFIYRHFPLISIHKNALDESRAIACAGKIGGAKSFYEYIDMLYGNKFSKQDPKTGYVPPLPQDAKELMAKSLGLDIGEFSLCMSNKESENIVNDSIAGGAEAGVQGTPSTFVLVENKKGYEIVSMIDGARDISFFEAAIEEALSR
ncbi:MAG: DsbA family protein [Candidatus Paceibacterota bacterium]